MLGNLSFIVIGIWLTKYDSINRRFAKSSSKSRILALAQSMESSLSKTCLVSADLSNRRCRMSAKCSCLRMEKLRFVSPMYEKSQSWHFHTFQLSMFLTTNFPWIGPTLKILDFELDFAKRRFIESYFINHIPNTMNDKQNDKFPSIYPVTSNHKT